MDHVQPISKGGKHTWTNVVTACNKCNNQKGNKNLSEYGKSPLHKPIEPQWLPNSDLKFQFQKIPESWKQYLIDLDFCG